jgi:transcription antitermination factor NusG
MDKKWYAVYTRPRWEKKVAENLSARDIVNYCPLNRVTRQWSDRKKLVYEPLFTSYVFVQLLDNEHRAVRECDGVINIVHWLGKPAIIKNEEIETIRRFLNQYTNVQIERQNIHINDRVRIINGPLSEMEGVIVYVNNNQVKVELPSLGCLMYVNLIKSNVHVLNKCPKTTAYDYEIVQ